MYIRSYRLGAFRACALLLLVQLHAQQTTVKLSSSASPSVFGQPVTLTATISPLAGAPAAGGEVTFYDGVTILGSRSVSSGQAALATNQLASGTRSLHAYYSGDSIYASGTSSAVTQVVKSVPITQFGPPVSYTPGSEPAAIAVGDLNGDGKVDFVVADILNRFVTVFLGNGDGSFQALKNMTTDYQPLSVAIADMNGDGKPDLLVASAGYPVDTGTVSVFLGNGDGTFQPGGDYPTGSGGGRLVAGDFNGDGKTDVAVLNYNESTFSVLLGNGDGSLQRRVNYVAGENPVTIAMGDFNGDGKADIVVGYGFGGALSIFLGKGDGTFQSGNSAPILLNSVPDSMVVEDFNGDGKMDIAVAGSDGVVNVLYGNGNGTFQTPVLYHVPPANTSQSLAIGDFDGDGRPDILVADIGGNITVILSAGGVLQLPPVTTGPAAYSAVAVGEFNGDGKTDIVYAFQYGIAIRLGGVGGSSTTAITASPNPSFAGQTVTLTATVTPSTATGTVTFYDGLTNLGTRPVSNGQAVFSTVFNVALPAFPFAVYSGDAFNAGSKSEVLVEVINPASTTVTLTSSANPSPFGSSVLLIATESPSSASGKVEFHDAATIIATQALSGGAAFFAASTLSPGSHSLIAVYPGDSNHVASTSPPINQTINSTAATSTTLAASGSQVTYGQGITLTAQVSPDPGSGKVTFYDGLAIMGTTPIAGGQAVLTTILPAVGARSIRARFAGSTGYAPSTSPTIPVTVVSQPGNSFYTSANYLPGGNSLAEADFNGDGKLDLAVGGNSTVSIFLGNGDGTFQLAVNYAAAAGPNYVAVADFDGDGKPDLAVSSTGVNSTLAIWLGNGNGTFQPTAAYFTVGGAMLVGDFNGDGYPDLAFSSGSVLLGNGDGTFQPAVNWVPGHIDLIGDLNGDGKLDVVSNGTPLLGNDDGTFRAATSVSSGATGNATPALAIGDFNNDGKPDLIATSYRPITSSNPFYGYTTFAALGRGDGTFAASAAFTTSSASSPVVVGDFNGDGNLDVAIFQSGVDIFLGHGDGTFGTGKYYPASGNSAAIVAGSVATGSFTGDGVSDFAFVTSSGLTVMLGTVLPSSTTILTSSLNPSNYGDNITLTATVTPSTATGTVTFYFNQMVIGTAPLVNGQASLTTNLIGPGQYSLTAVYLGDANTYTSTSAPLIQVVNVATPTVSLTASVNPASAGQSVILTARLSDSLATGSIVFQDGAKPIGTVPVNAGVARLLVRALSVGPHVIQAAFTPGDSYNNPGTSSVLLLTINQGTSSSVVLTSSANPATYSQPVTIAATVSPADATGSVNFYDGANFLGSRTVSGGQASMMTSVLASGSRPLRAYYSGDGNYTPATSAVYTQAVRSVSAVTFQGPLNQPLSQALTSLAVADFNGDGITDVVTGDYFALHIFLGNGGGTFRSPVTIPAPSSNDNLYVVVADVNGDGKPDLVVGYGYSITLYINGPPATLSIHLGNGDGTFQPPMFYDAGNSPRSIVVTDVNGDGLPDIVVGDYAGGQYNTGYAANVGVLLGNGDGTFQPMSRVNAYSNGYVQTLLAGDFNRDGNTDLAVSDGNIETMLVGNGDGTFQVGSSYGINNGIVATTSDDFNGDGITDLAIACSDGTVSLRLGNGDGTFKPPTTLTAGLPVGTENNFAFYGVGIDVGDFDGDGNLDIAVTNALGVVVFSGNGDGSFKDPLYYGGSSALVRAADLNGDGRIDLVFSNYIVSGTPILNLSALTGTDAPVPSISSAGIVNAASPVVATPQTPGVPLVPGSLGTAYGSFLVNPPVAASGSPVPNQLSGVSAQFGNGLSAPIISVASNKVTFQVPWELAGQLQTTLSITVNSESSGAQALKLSSFAPGIFSINGQGTGQAMVYDMSNRLVDASNPATAGSTVVQIYCTGLGAVSNQPATGYAGINAPSSLTTLIPNVTIGGFGAPVLFSGLIPGVVGMYQVTVLVPQFANWQPNQPITISYGGMTSNAYGGMTSNAPTIAVRSIAPNAAP